MLMGLFDDSFCGIAMSFTFIGGTDRKAKIQMRKRYLKTANGPLQNSSYDILMSGNSKVYK